MMPRARALALERLRWIGGHADAWQIFRDCEALAAVIRALAGPFRDDGVTAVCGIESRGFLLGAAVAVELGVGLIAVRGDKATQRSDPDYQGTRQELRLQRAAVGSADRVLQVRRLDGDGQPGVGRAVDGRGLRRTVGRLLRRRRPDDPGPTGGPRSFRLDQRADHRKIPAMWSPAR
ncbi:hypothetical protein ABZT06_46855 [Streptomyces sp. NPDC005483]|uniref:hypothetical protein n=1 Tax=Streptomyces sp. NPDC005483 TaxID=3154882 RepID=UPI0033BE22E8